MSVPISVSESQILRRLVPRYLDAGTEYCRIESEYESTLRAFLAISGQKTLLASNPARARSIRNRIPYIDPLNPLQIELLRRHRAGKSNERVQRGIHLSINGIAAGLRNSG